MKFKYLLHICCLGTSLVASAQLTEQHTFTEKTFHKALRLYENKQYAASKYFFEQAMLTDPQRKSTYLYYIASASVRSGENSADTQMEDYLKKYPHSIYAVNAQLDIADFYFTQGNYAQALLWYEKATFPQMSSAETDRHNFQKGYALFVTGKKDRAKAYFEQVGEGNFSEKAAYYLGYIAYEQEDYDQASAYFQALQNSSQWGKNLSYYQANMNFKQGDFQKAIEDGLAQLQQKKNSSKDISEINKIIGESYFNLKQYDKAIKHLTAYKGKSGKYSNTDFYYLGYAYYQQKEYQKAIEQFNKIIEWENSVAQNAYYHLAECYLKTDQKQQALNAFRNAWQMNFSPEIKKDAHLNYAKLSYEIGNPYQSVSEVITSYMKEYPNENTQQMKALLVNSYLTSKNYKSALSSLEKSSEASDREIYQKVALMYALELYADRKYSQALPLFEKAVHSSDKSISQSAIFWLGETNYLLNNFSKSQADYQKFLLKSLPKNEYYVQALYGLAYSFFEQKQYLEAIENFTKFLSVSRDLASKEDATLRIADSHFVLAKYWVALEWYDKILKINGTDADYATFQKAISFGLVDRIPKKIDQLNYLVENFPKSPLRQNAIYELGNTLLSIGKTQEALQKYQQVQNQYEQGAFISQAMLREALVYYNQDEYEKSLQVIEKITKKYPNTSQAVQAVNIAKSVYVDMGKVEQYGRWAKSLGYVEVSDVELDNASFEAAERQYLQQNEKEAIANFEKYLKDFPQGLHRLQVQYLLAQMYFNAKNTEQALPLYEEIILQGANEYTEQTLVRLSQIYLDKSQQKKAQKSLEQLEEISSNTQNVLYAQSNLMKLFYQNQEYQKTILYAGKVLANNQLDSRIEADAYIMMARSYIKTGQEDKAWSYYEKVQKTASGELMAEAIYYQAYFKNKDGYFADSNQIIQKLAKEYGGYKEFSAKGLVLMAKNFNQLNDNYQATYILSSVIDNFKQFPELVQEAQKFRNQIKQQEAQKNTSVEQNL